jgi:N-methylhydantoinase B
VLGSVQHISEQSERRARASVATIPDGVYEAESFMDDDGISPGKPIPLRVRVTVAGDEMTIDLSEVSRQVGGYYNSGITAGRSAAEVAFKCITSPLWLPINYGSFRPLNVVLPPGRVISATKPAAMRMWMTIPMTVVDTIFKAMAQAVPERAIAGHHADLLSSHTYGVDHRTGRFFFGFVGPLGGGWGAKYNEDGANATICINDGDTHNSPAEASEVKSPLVVEEHSLVPDSGGAGRYRGGLGIRRVVRMLTACNFTTRIERTQCAPWGLQDGQDARANRVYVRRADGSIEQPPNGKIDILPLAPGDTYVLESGGGGGFGDPRERPPEQVLRDVQAGYISAACALDDYGVVLTGDGTSIDAATTEQRRGEHRAGLAGA